MAEDLASPWQANQVIVFKHAAMRLKFRPRLEADNEILMAEPYQLCQVAVFNFYSLSIPGQYPS
jgi:hypothetical protein